MELKILLQLYISIWDNLGNSKDSFVILNLNFLCNAYYYPRWVNKVFIKFILLD